MRRNLVTVSTATKNVTHIGRFFPTEESARLTCVFRSNAATDFGSSRPVILV